MAGNMNSTPRSIPEDNVKLGWARLCCAVVLLAGVAVGAEPADYKTALRDAAAELKWKADEVEITDGPINIADDYGEVIYRGHKFNALLGYTVTLTVVENLDTTLSPDSRPYVDYTLGGLEGEAAEKMPTPFTGTKESWRSGGYKRVVEEQYATWIFYIGLTTSRAVAVNWMYGSNETPDAETVQRFAEVLAKHVNRLGEPTSEELSAQGELRIIADPCLDADGNRRRVVVQVSTKDGKTRTLYNSQETKVQGNQISRISVDGECGATIHRDDGSYYRIEPGFEREGIVTWSERLEGADKMGVRLWNGFGLFFLPPSSGAGPGKRFEAETNVVRTGVNGTLFTLSHDARVDRSVVSVREGEVQVTPLFAGAQPFTLRAGQQVDILPGRVGAVVPATTSPGVTGSGTGAGTGIDLTGYWLDDNSDMRSCYRIRQVADELFWQMDARPEAVNVFHGVIAGNTVVGEWADLPSGRLSNSGALSLRIEGADRMVKVGFSADYGGNIWRRVSTCGTP